MNLEVGRLEGVVDSDDDVLVGGVSDVGHGFDVDQLQGRVGRRLDPDQPGVGADGSGHLAGEMVTFKDRSAVLQIVCRQHVN